MPCQTGSVAHSLHPSFFGKGKGKFKPRFIIAVNEQWDVERAQEENRGCKDELAAHPTEAPLSHAESCRSCRRKEVATHAITVLELEAHFHNKAWEPRRRQAGGTGSLGRPWPGKRLALEVSRPDLQFLKMLVDAWEKRAGSDALSTLTLEEAEPSMGSTFATLVGQVLLHLPASRSYWHGATPCLTTSSWAATTRTRTTRQPEEHSSFVSSHLRVSMPKAAQDLLSAKTNRLRSPSF